MGYIDSSITMLRFMKMHSFVRNNRFIEIPKDSFLSHDGRVHAVDQHDISHNQYPHSNVVLVALAHPTVDNASEIR
jgi:hypothetical protein